MLWEAAAVSLLHKYNSSMEGSALVNIVWRGQKQRILLYPGISSSEVQGVLDAVFHSGDAGGGPVLGLKDAGTGIAYPLSYITAHPSQFGGGSFELVMAVASHEKPPSFLAAARKSHNDLDICSNQISNRPFEPSTSNLSGEESGSPEDDMTAALERIALVKRTLSLEVIDSIQLKYLFLQSRDEDTARELSLASFVRCMGRLGAESSSRNALIPLIFDVFVGSSGKASIDALTNGLSVSTPRNLCVCKYFALRIYYILHICRTDILPRFHRGEDCSHVHINRYCTKWIYQVFNWHLTSDVCRSLHILPLFAYSPRYCECLV
jgi:hypothetical protein